MTTDTRPAAPARWQSAVPIGTGLIVAELLLAFWWYPWVVEHLVLGSHLPFEVLRLLIVAPEYILLAIGVYLLASRPTLRLPAVALALLAGLVSWGVSTLLSHIAHTLAQVTAHQRLLDTLSWITLITLPTLASLAWGVARRRGRLWLLAVPVAPALHWVIQHSDRPLRIQTHVGFRVGEVVGMAFVILPVLLAILAGWALEQVEHPVPAPPV